MKSMSGLWVASHHMPQMGVTSIALLYLKNKLLVLCFSSVLHFLLVVISGTLSFHPGVTRMCSVFQYQEPSLYGVGLLML